LTPFKKKKSFVPENLEMLERFAQIAAIAIVNARLYESEHANRVRLEVLNNEITRRPTSASHQQKID
jgi:GAF domain-containing protein